MNSRDGGASWADAMDTRKVSTFRAKKLLWTLISFAGASWYIGVILGVW